MKITQICGGNYVGRDGETWGAVYGLGEDNKLYKWSHWNGKWELYERGV